MAWEEETPKTKGGEVKGGRRGGERDDRQVANGMVVKGVDLGWR